MKGFIQNLFYIGMLLILWQCLSAVDSAVKAGMGVE